MKKAILIFLILFCQKLYGQSVRLDSLKNDEIEIIELKIKGFKAIRHDALITCRFYYAHYIKGLIKEEECNLEIKKSLIK